MKCCQREQVKVSKTQLWINQLWNRYSKKNWTHSVLPKGLSNRNVSPLLFMSATWRCFNFLAFIHIVNLNDSPDIDTRNHCFKRHTWVSTIFVFSSKLVKMWISHFQSPSEQFTSIRSALTTSIQGSWEWKRRSIKPQRLWTHHVKH